ncbi:MAG: 23S rRNA (uracil(1939)-C(5))-methyltransferase RlmD [Lachnospiraceae bacterium]|nr:23S rRNA (uracil(1939)-C(5))-methyltransferase RlmD [Lachnospiraceae bacterium]
MRKQDNKIQRKANNKTNNKTNNKANNKPSTRKKHSSKCPFSDKCGGCQYIDKTYEEQLDIKEKELCKLLGGFGNMEPIIGSDNPYHYRNKVNAAFKRKKSGEIISGTYAEGTHNILPVTNCYIEDEQATKIMSTIRDLVRSFKITTHNEDTGYGLLKHVMIRTARKTGQIMVVLVTASPVFPSKNNFVKALRNVHPEITTVVQNINQKHTSMVLGDRNQIMYGKGFIEDVLCGKRFRISPNSFYQINPGQTEKLYMKAIEFAGLTGKEVVLDAYCGIGTIGIVASDKAKEVIGVELNKEAVHDAISNAKLNGVKNIQFYNNDAGIFMVGMANEGAKVDVVFMDPPRTGSDQAFMSSVMKLAPKKIVYISCGPDTLARDLKYMTKDGKYKVERMVGCDMFSFTSHVETVVLLSKSSVM